VFVQRPVQGHLNEHLYNRFQPKASAASVPLVRVNTPTEAIIHGVVNVHS